MKNKIININIFLMLILIILYAQFSSATTDFAGCVENAIEIRCESITDSGTYIDTNKNITIISSTLNVVGLGGSTNVQIRLNSSSGNITISSSTINSYSGNAGGNSQGFNGNFQVHGALKGLYITSSTINSYGGNAACASSTAQNGGNGQIDITKVTGNITYNGAILYSYGGNGCAVSNGNFGNGGSGSFSSKSQNVISTGNSVIINSYGGNGGVGGSSGSGTSTGGTGTCTFGDSNIFTLGSSNITANCYGGSTSGSYGTLIGGSGNLNFENTLFLNASMRIEFSGGSPGNANAQLKAIINMTTSRFIFKESYLNGAPSSGGSGTSLFLAREVTLLNNTIFSGVPATSIINSSSDVFRVGIFNGSQYGFTLNYNQSFGVFIVNSTLSTLNGGIPVYRNQSDYYFPIHKLDAPTNSQFKFPGLIQFNSTYISEYYTPSNMTFYLWDYNGNLVNRTTVIVSGQQGIPNLTISLTNISIYYWNTVLTSSNNLQQLWYGITNYSFFVGGSINNYSYNSSTYETSSENFFLNLSSGGEIVSFAYLVYNGINYSASLQIYGNDTIIIRRIDIPLGGGNKSFLWRFNIGGTEFVSQNFTQSVSTINLTLCGAIPQNVQYINFTIKEEGTFILLNSSIEAVWLYWLGQGTSNKSFIYSNITDNNTNYRFCFTPSDRTIYLNGITEYYKTGYDRRSYYFSNTSKTNSSAGVDLYLLSTATSDIVTYTVVDDFLTPVKGAEIRILRWDLISDQFYLVNTIVTDENGQASSNIRLNDAWYMYMVSYNRMLYLTTTPSKETSIAKTLQIFLQPTQTIYQILNAISSTLTFNNVTNVFSFTYSDASNSISGACLKVSKISAFNNTIAQSCSNSPSSILTYGVTTNGTYLARGIVSYNTGSSIIYWTLNNLYIDLGLDARFITIGRAAQAISLVFIGTMAMVGVATGSIPVGLILIGASFIILNLLGFVNFTTSFVTTIISMIILTIISLQRRYG